MVLCERGVVSEGVNVLQQRDLHAKFSRIQANILLADLLAPLFVGWRGGELAGCTLTDLIACIPAHVIIQGYRFSARQGGF